MQKLFIIIMLTLGVSACNDGGQDAKDSAISDAQQKQYAISQPVPSYDWSLERHMVIELLNSRNMKAATHSVWRSNTGVIEGDCASIGFGIPYDTSLTNPSKVMIMTHSAPVVEQAEPNGIFISKNTSATWVMCAGEHGGMDPIYIESKVTVYPYPVSVKYDTNRVIKAGKSTVNIK